MLVPLQFFGFCSCFPFAPVQQNPGCISTLLLLPVPVVETSLVSSLLSASSDLQFWGISWLLFSPSNFRKNYSLALSASPQVKLVGRSQEQPGGRPCLALEEEASRKAGPKQQRDQEALLHQAGLPCLDRRPLLATHGGKPEALSPRNLKYWRNLWLCTCFALQSRGNLCGGSSEPSAATSWALTASKLHRRPGPSRENGLQPKSGRTQSETTKESTACTRPCVSMHIASFYYATIQGGIPLKIQ